MKFLYFIPLLFIATTSLDLANKQHLFSEVFATVTPGQIADHILDVQGLIQIGEDSRALALHNQSIAQGIYDNALNNWQIAFDEEQTALGNQKSAEEAEAAAVAARDTAIDFKNQRIDEKNFADGLVPPAENFMNDEIARVDEEKVALEKVKAILEGLNSPGRRLLSRTSTLLTHPAFLASLTLADPAAVQQVLDIVLNLIQEGEDARNFAIGEYNDRVSEAAVAAQNLVDAETALASREAELVDATAFRVEMTSIAEGKSAVEVEKREIRDEKKEKLEIQIAFTNREIARIDGEKAILEADVGLIDKLEQIAQLLASR